WQLEVAAMLAPLGTITLPPELIDKLHNRHMLADAERKIIARVPAVTEQLLGNIPRLEGVLAILNRAHRPRRVDAAPDPAGLAAEALRAAQDFDELSVRGDAAALVIDTMRGREGAYDPAVLAALKQVAGRMAGEEVRELALSAVRVGMVFVDDVRLVAGGLLVAHGYEVTQGFLERVRNFAAGSVREPVRVSVKT
ncbi:MAG TPA: HD domain-containing phosphohydrolase, partial [Myxococcota bacterium]